MLASDLLREVKLLAAEKPDAIYAKQKGRCWYTKGEAGGEYGCIIGQAIKRLNPELFISLKFGEEAGLNYETVGTLVDLGLIEGDICKLSEIQYSQDIGWKWGDCIWPR